MDTTHIDTWTLTLRNQPYCTGVTWLELCAQLEVLAHWPTVTFCIRKSTER